MTRSSERSPVAAALNDVVRDRWIDRAAPAGDDDLAGRLWRRAAGAAVGVLVATTLGAVLGGFGALVAGGAAALFAYGFGPLVLAAEVRRFPVARPPTGSQLGRHWAVAAVAVVAMGATATGVTNGIVGILVTLVVLGVGGPIAAGAAVAAVVAGARLPASAARMLAVVVPVTLFGLLAWEVARGPDTEALGVVDGALVLAVVVLVPLAVPLAVPGTTPRCTVLAVMTLLTGGWAAVALALPQGVGAAAATGPWMGLCAALAVAAWVRWLRQPSVDHLVVAVAAGYLAVGAGWLLADRAGLEPAGFGPPFVQLTAIHFTYAGAVGTVLAWQAWRRRSHDRSTVVAITATTAGPPLVAAGFVAYGPLQIVGAVVLTVGTYAYGWVVLRQVVGTVDRRSSWLLGASAVSVVVPMLLAVQWAVGWNLGTPALSIPAMAATHGIANAVGFCLLGVLGWRRAAAGAADAEVR